MGQQGSSRRAYAYRPRNGEGRAGGTNRGNRPVRAAPAVTGPPLRPLPVDLRRALADLDRRIAAERDRL